MEHQTVEDSSPSLYGDSGMIQKQMEELQSLSLSSFKKVLFIQPHPDDNEVGAGATVAKLAAQGVEVHYATVTDGGLGTLDPEITPSELISRRRREHEESGRFLGASVFHWLGFPDGGLYDAPPLREAMVRLIREVRPDLLFTVDPWNPYEAHFDHLYTGKAVAYAAITAAFPLAFPEHLKEGLTPHAPRYVAFYATSRPNHIEDVSSYWDRKMKAIRLHQSQFQGEELLFVQQYLTYKGKELGERFGFPLGEGFKILTPQMLHMNVDAENM
ncbi:MAG: PIG-L family deacetylase [Thermicanus sp.]|nr:PIG-L family deacetylase [Thermicanus sp.]